jgi:hypothetical protein
LRASEPAFRQRGAALAAVGLGDRRYAQAFRAETGITFPLLVDERREAYRAMELKSAHLFHIFRSDNGQAGKNPFQLGGSFVFGPGDVDRFAHWSETFGDNASIESLLAHLP